MSSVYLIYFYVCVLPSLANKRILSYIIMAFILTVMAYPHFT